MSGSSSMAEKGSVDLASLGAFVDGVKTEAISPEVRFSARSRWTGATRTEVTVDRFYAGGNDVAPLGRSFKLVVDEPAALGGGDSGPNPVEYLAAALCGCITAGIATNAAMFGTEVEGIEVSVDADINVMGLFGLDRSVPSACNTISYSVKLTGKDGAALEKSKQTIDRKSPVRNTLGNAVEIVARDG